MEKIFYNTSDNKKLCGILDICNNSDNVVIICHARGSSKDSKATTRLQEELSQNNINSFKFDFRGHGESEGDFEDQLTSNFKKDLEDTITRLNGMGYTNIHLIGTSMGGKIVSLIDYSRFNIKSITLWYPAILNFKSKISVILNKMFKSKDERLAMKEGYVKVASNNFNKVSRKYFEDDRQFIPVKNLKTARCPILIIHGTNDKYVDFKDSEYVHKIIPNSILYPIEGGGHSFKDETHLKKALNLTIVFLKEMLQKKKTQNKTK